MRLLHFCMTPAILFELFAFLLALLGVLLTARGHVAGWVFGILGSALYVPVFFESRLYAETGLQLFYILLGIYGWWHWLRLGNNAGSRPVHHIPLQTAILLSILFVLGSGVLGLLLSHFSNTDVPYLDATMGVSGLLITWMMARKFIENWWCWVFIDCINSGLFIYKSLHLTAFLYLVMAALAVYGGIRWKKDLVSS